MNARPLALALSTATLTTAAHAVLVFSNGTGSAVAAATNVATFTGVSTGTDLSAYREAGLSVTVPSTAYTAFDPTYGNAGSGFSGGFFYPLNEPSQATLIARADGTPLQAVEFTVGDGYGSTTAFGRYFGVKGGTVYSTGTFSALAGSTVGLADPFGFDALYIGVYDTAADANVATVTSKQAGALDNLRVQAVPEPATLGMVALGLTGLVRRRRRAN